MIIEEHRSYRAVLDLWLEHDCEGRDGRGENGPKNSQLVNIQYSSSKSGAVRANGDYNSIVYSRSPSEDHREDEER